MRPDWNYKDERHESAHAACALALGLSVKSLSIEPDAEASAHCVIEAPSDWWTKAILLLAPALERG